MYLLNDNYKERKELCNKLFKKYRTFDFAWSNQSYTSISNSLFKQITGFIQQSSYNVKTRDILDQFYPRALQWCTRDNIPDNTVNIDISKCYPDGLLNNTTPIPVYDIHNTIKKFNDLITDIRGPGETYIDETILMNYGTPIKIRSRFLFKNVN